MSFRWCRPRKLTPNQAERPHQRNRGSTYLYTSLMTATTFALAADNLARQPRRNASEGFTEDV